MDTPLRYKGYCLTVSGVLESASLRHPDGNLEELSRRNQAIAERQRIRTAFGQALRHAGFPVLDTAGPLHWTIVLA